MSRVHDGSQQNDRFRVLFEHSSDAHFIFDETGITDCNDATIKLLKAVDKAQILALHPAVLSPECQPDGRRSLEKAQEMDGIARARGYHRFEWTHRKLDGELFPVEVTLNSVEIGGRQALPDGAAFGATRLTDAFRSASQIPLADAVQQVVGAIEGWAGPGGPQDDVSVVAFEIGPTESDGSMQPIRPA